MREQEIEDYVRSLSAPKRPVSKWVYKQTCEGCKNYVDFRIQVLEESVLYKYCTSMQGYVGDPKVSCLLCDDNRANPSSWFKFKYKVKQLWKKIKS